MSNIASREAPLPWTPGSQAGIEYELRCLMGENEQALLRFTQPLVQDTDLARDCVQETFLRAFEALGRGGQVNRTWLLRVAYGRAMDEHRRRRRLRAAYERLPAAPFPRIERDGRERPAGDGGAAAAAP